VKGSGGGRWGKIKEETESHEKKSEKGEGKRGTESNGGKRGVKRRVDARIRRRVIYATKKRGGERRQVGGRKENGKNKSGVGLFKQTCGAVGRRKGGEGERR